MPEPALFYTGLTGRAGRSDQAGRAWVRWHGADHGNKWETGIACETNPSFPPGSYVWGPYGLRLIGGGGPGGGG